MTTHAGAPGSTPESSRVLYLVAGYEGLHLVSAATLEGASAAQDDAEEEVLYDTFGELRRSGDVEQLRDRICDWTTIEEYVRAIERVAGVTATNATLEVRLAALVEVPFDGDDDANAPGDNDRCRSQGDVDSDVEDDSMQTIAEGMVYDVPAEVLDRFGLVHSPMFASNRIAFVDEVTLPEVVEALEQLGRRRVISKRPVS